jgi:hypothetical protein
MKIGVLVAAGIVLCFVGSPAMKAQDLRSSLVGNPNDLGQSFPQFSPQPSPEALDYGSEGAAKSLQVDAYEGGFIPIPLLGLNLRASGRAVLDTFYDTGAMASSSSGLFYPSTIAPDGTKAAQAAGRFQMLGTTSTVQLDLVASAVPGRPEAFTEFDFANSGEGEVRLRKAFGVYNVSPAAALIGGQLMTTFVDELTRPVSIVNDGTPAGAVLRRQALLRYFERLDNGFSRSLAIENPTSTDFVLPDPADDVRLQRMPDLVANVGWVRPDDNLTRAQVAVLVRGLGYEDEFGDEDFVAGWGINATARFRVYCDNNVQCGVVGGQGLGRYVFGFGADEKIKPTAGDVMAAGPDAAGELLALPTIGWYVGYQHVWTPYLISNLAYGFAHVEPAAGMDGLLPQTTQNAWANFVYAINEKLYLGLEAQYGEIETINGTSGDNLRLQMTLSYLAGTGK